MNCAEFQATVHELARGDANATLGESNAMLARLHAQVCDACAANLAEARTLAKAIADAAQDSQAWEAPAHVKERLAAKFREHHQNLERVRNRERRTRLRWAEWIGLAAAAAVLMTIGAWNVSRKNTARNEHSSASSTISSSANSGVNSAINGASGTEVSQSDAADADFVPLPYGESISAESSGLVVRVSMTRGTLENLGYPVNEVNAGEVIQADLLVGEDGLPVAVRLAQ